MIMPILAVKDVDASIAFYTDKLGFEKTMALPGPDGKNAFAFVQKDDSIIGLSLDSDTANVGKGVTLMVYVDDSVDIKRYYSEVKKKGVTLTGDLKKEYWGDMVFSLHDVDGYALSMCQTVEEADMDEMAAIMRGDRTGDTEVIETGGVDLA